MADKKKTRSKNKHGLGLGIKFSFFVGLLFTVIMIATTVFMYNQQKVALEKEVKQRGLAIAMNLANNAEEALTTKEELTLFVLAKQAIQDPMTSEEEQRQELWQKVIELIKRDIKTGLLGQEVKKDEMIKNEGILNAVVIDNGGTIVSASGQDRMIPGSKYTIPPGVKPIHQGDEVKIQEYTQNGKRYYDVGAPIYTIGDKVLGEVHLKVSQDIIAKIVLAGAVKIVLITLAGLITGIIFSVLLVNFMISPLRLLVKGVRAIGEGDYNVRIKIKSRDEIGELTEAFNSTAKSLQEKEVLKGAFSTYVSSAVMDEVMKDPKKLSLHGKRVHATMLFTDIRGFTSMSETLEPEQVVSVINEYLTLQTDKVFKWEGLLDKFVGDCVMAVYGIPFAKDDDAYRAVRTAMDIRDGLEKLNIIREKRKQHVVGIGIGINTGDVVSGNMGSPQKMDYTVIGDNVNLAARLEANAPSGKIYVSGSTYEATKDLIEYTELESIMVKGKKDPVRVFEPIKVVET